MLQSSLFSQYIFLRYSTVEPVEMETDEKILNQGIYIIDFGMFYMHTLYNVGSEHSV